MAHHNEEIDPNIKEWEWAEKNKTSALFNQMVNISKAHGYDILADHVKELKQVIRDLIESGDLNDLEFTDKESTDEFKTILNKAKILSI